MDKSLQRNIEVSLDSYLDRISRGRRSGYVRAIVDHHLSELLEAVSRLRAACPDEQIAALVAEADTPRRHGPVDLDSLPDTLRQAVIALADECEMTGLAVAEVIAELVAGAHA